MHVRNARDAALSVLVGAVLLLGACSGGDSSGTDAQSCRTPPSKPDRPWSIAADGAINAVAVHCDTVFVGGSFSMVGALIDSPARLGADDGRVLPSSFGVEGAVSAVVDDGAGGWFVAGDFERVDGGGCPGLAHVRSGGSVAPWCPRPHGSVSSLARIGARLYLAGSFDAVGGARRAGLAAVDTVTGRALPWAPTVGDISLPAGADPDLPSVSTSLSPYVSVVAAAGDKVFTGGYFERIGGEKRASLAAIDARTGRVSAWDARLGTAGGFPPVVDLLVASGGVVYVAGDIAREGAFPATTLTAVDDTTGRAIWRQHVAGGKVRAVAVLGNGLYVGGGFERIGGKPRSGLARVNAATGRLTAWSPRFPSLSAVVVTSLLVQNRAVVAAGSLPSGRGAPDAFVTSIDSRGAGALRWTQRTGAVATVLSGDGRGAILAFGVEVVGQPRSSLAAFDLVSGRLRPWQPSIRGSVGALLAHGDTLYVGGGIARVSGNPRAGLAAFALPERRLLPWHPALGTFLRGGVNVLAADDDKVFVGGAFRRAGGERRRYLAAFDARTGELDPFDAQLDAGLARREVAGHEVFGLALAGDKVFVGGQFTKVGGEKRAALAAIDRDSGQVTDWDAALGSAQYAPAVWDLVELDGLLYIAGEFVKVGGVARLSLAALNLATGRATDWEPRLRSNDPSESQASFLRAAEETLIVTGAFDAVNGVARRGVAEVDADSGNPTAWRPRERGDVLAVARDGGPVFLVASEDSGPSVLHALPLRR